MIRRLTRELPLLAGIGAGCFGMWWHGRAFVPMDWPAGFDWERYLRETWAHLNPGTMNSTWLEPLYSTILGHFGSVHGFAWTGLVISSVSVMMVVVGTGLLGRALGGSLVGGLAAVAVPLTPQLSAAARWVNLYPLLSGTTALGLAGSVALARWPRWYWAVAGGLFSGLAWAVDGRTVTLLPGLVLLALTGAVTVKGGGRKLVLLALYAAGLAVGPVSQSMLRVVPRESTAQVAEILRGIELSKLRNSPNASLRSACMTERSEIINLHGLIRPCATALAADNLGRVDEGTPFGLWLSLLLLPFALLPGRGGWRQSWTAALAIVPFVGMTLVMSRWLIVTPRYMMQVAAPAAVIVPLGVVQLIRTITGTRIHQAWAALGPIALAVWLFKGGPNHPDPGPLERSSTYTMMAPVVRYIDAHPDAVFLDCSESHIEASILPRQTHAWPNNHEGHDWDRCASWLRDPEGEGTAMMAVGTRTQLPGRTGLGVPPPWRETLRSEGMGQTMRIWELDAAFNHAP